jgi:hypothetical protein
MSNGASLDGIASILKLVRVLPYQKSTPVGGGPLALWKTKLHHCPLCRLLRLCAGEGLFSAWSGLKGSWFPGLKSEAWATRPGLLLLRTERPT